MIEDVKGLRVVSEFEWDSGNIHQNWRKHQVNFYECEEVFLNQPLLLGSDDGHSNNEKHYYVLGKTTFGRQLFIAFTRRGKKIRVICARDMNRKEKQIYAKAT